MLSFIFQISNRFEREHGRRPNMLYLGPCHYRRLRQELVDIPCLDEVARLLGMEIVLTSEAIHPHVAWSSINWRTAVAV